MHNFIEQIRQFFKFLFIGILYFPLTGFAILSGIVARAFLEFIAVWFSEEDGFNEYRYQEFVRKLILLFFQE